MEPPNHDAAPRWYSLFQERFAQIYSPEQTIEDIYRLPGGRSNLYSLLRHIESLPGFQADHKLREYYRLGRLKLQLQREGDRLPSYTDCKLPDLFKRQFESPSGSPQEADFEEDELPLSKCPRHTPPDESGRKRQFFVEDPRGKRARGEK